MTGQIAVWDFRANQDAWTVEELTKWLRAHAKKYVFQLEKGDSGYIHWQGRCRLIKKRQKHIILELADNKFNYLEPTTTVNHKDEFFYAMKEDTRLEGPFRDSDDENDNYLPIQYRNISLYPFQEKILETGNMVNFREINLIYDPLGCCGKSTVAAIGELLHGGIDMPPLNDFKELIGTLCNICMDRNIRNPKLIYFDMPRAIDKSKLYGLYSAIEQVKKGKLYDMRYHYKCWWIDSPTIWVFTNMLPDTNLLSLDRWKIWTIDKTTMSLVPYSEEQFI